MTSDAHNRPGELIEPDARPWWRVGVAKLEDKHGIRATVADIRRVLAAHEPTAAAFERHYAEGLDAAKSGDLEPLLGCVHIGFLEACKETAEPGWLAASWERWHRPDDDEHDLWHTPHPETGKLSRAHLWNETPVWDDEDNDWERDAGGSP